MPLLKSTSPAAAAPQPFSMRDIERQAAAILARAQQQASALLEQAQVEAEQLRAAAEAQGRAAGRAEGQKQGVEQGLAAGRQQALAEHKAQLASLVAALSSAAGQVEKSRQELVQQGTDAVVALAVAVARKAVSRFTSANPPALLDTVSEALRFVVGQNDVRIAVNPADKLMLEECLPQIQARWPNLQHVRIVADPAVGRGGARLITRHGEVDATLDGMIDRIAEQLIPDRPGDAGEPPR